MVQKTFTFAEDASMPLGWKIIDTETSKELPMPSCVMDFFASKYLPTDFMLDIVDTVKIALAGVTDSLNPVAGQEYSFDRRSVVKTFKIKPNTRAIDSDIDFILTSQHEYEQYHTIYMGRDKDGDDGSIHAYIVTPKNGVLRSVFDKDVRIMAKRNNIKYWIDDYKIETGTAGGKYIRPVNKPVEIMD